MITQKKGSTKWLAIALATAGLAGWAGSAGADATAMLDRGTLAVGERLQLKIRSQGASMGAEPDLSALANDFYVLGRSQSIRTTIVNGRRDASVDWLIELTPLRAGVLEIPAISVGSDSTKSLRVTVIEGIQVATAGEPGGEAVRAPRGIRLIAEVDRMDPYVQEQVALTLRLESARPIESGSLTEPKISGAIVETLGEDLSDVVEIDGQPVYVFERRYSVFPQQSGALMIQPSVFEGEVQDHGARSSRGRRGLDPFAGSGLDDLMGGSLFDDFFGSSGSLFERVLGSRGQPVRAISDPVQLSVRERPQDAPGQRWLPAQDLELVELWGDGSTQPPPFEVGQPVNRVVVVRARGVTASQLPIPQLGEVSGLKQYTEPAYEDAKEVDGGLVAVRALPTVLIPTRSGSFTLPAVEVEWWDTRTDQPRTATLAARTVEVRPARGGEPFAASAVLAPVLAPDDPGAGPPPPLSLSKLAEPGDSSPSRLGLGLAVAGGLVGLGWLYRRRVRMAPGGANAVQRQLLRRRQHRVLRRACAAGQGEEAENALLALGRLRWPDAPPRSTGELASRLATPDLRETVASLSAHRYADDDNPSWDGTTLWRAYRRSGLGRRKEPSSPSDSALAILPQLYPSG